MGVRHLLRLPATHRYVDMLMEWDGEPLEVGRSLTIQFHPPFYKEPVTRLASRLPDPVPDPQEKAYWIESN